MTTEPVAIPDAAARATALDPSRSFIVQAPAGSGKTELLVRRFLSLLATAKRPESVLAITFTRKAAAEMRERVVSALKEGRRPEPDPPAHHLERIELARKALARSEAQGWELLENAGRLQISTIDSLCARLVAATPLLSRLGSAPKTVENAFPYFREAARRVLAHAGEDSELGRAAAGMLARREVRGRDVEGQIVSMLARRDQWLGGVLDSNKDPDEAIARFEQALAGMMEAQLLSITELFGDDFLREIESLARMTRNVLDGLGNLEKCKWPTLGSGAGLAGDLGARDAWVDVVALLLKDDNDFRLNPRGITVALGAPPRDPKTKQDSPEKVAYLAAVERAADLDEQTGGAVVAALKALRIFPAKPEFEADTHRALRDLFIVMRDAAAQLWLVFQEAGAVDFIEVASRAVAALVDDAAPTDLLQKIDASVDHVLVDEFQDTSRSQVGLIRSLVSGWQGDDGRTLFLVGDPMQSIYRFRKAEVGLFLHAADSEAGAPLFGAIQPESLKLSVNFRSTPDIVAWVNNTFSVVMGAHNDVDTGSVAYSEFAAAPGKPGLAVPEAVVWEKGDGQKADAVEAEGLADLIENELLLDARTRGGKVAVLVHKRAVAIHLTAALRSRGVRYRGEGMDFLDKRTAVIDLESLTRAIVSPLDRIGALSVLRSPLVGLGDADLFALVEPGVARYRSTVQSRSREGESVNSESANPETMKGEVSGKSAVPSVAELLADEEALASLGSDGRGRVRAWHAVWSDARAQLGRRPLDMIVRSAWIRLGGPQLLDATGPADSERFFSLLIELENAGSIDLHELSERLSQLEAVADPSPGIELEFMTIHKSKGLEFDTVVLPGLIRGGGGGGGPSAALVFETSSATGELVCCAPSAERGKQGSDDAAYTYLCARERVRDSAEALRLMYVAATRAKNRLILSAADEFNQNGTPAKGSRLDSLWAAVAEQFSGDGPRRKPPEAVDGAVLPPRSRVSLAWLGDPSADKPEVPHLQSVRAMRPSEQSEVEPHEAASDSAWSPSRASIAVGLVVHAYLERIAGEGPAAWSAQRVGDASERARIERLLLKHGALPGELGEAAADVVSALSSTLADEENNWILDAQDEAHDEWRVTSYVGGDAVGGSDDVEEPVIGYAGIDRTFVKDGVRWIIDYKTDRLPEGGDPAAFVKERFEHHRPQLESYAEMLAAAEPERKIRIAVYFPMVGRVARLYSEEV